MKLPLDLTLLTNARLQDGSLVDVMIDGDTVTEVRPAAQRTSPSAVADTAPTVADGKLDLDGYLLLTASAEPHAHLDKALSWSHITPKMGDLEDAIRSWQSYTDTMTVESIAERAREEALALLSNGITAVRSHVDLLLGDQPLRGVHALLQVREELKDLIDIELVALGNPFTPSAQYEAAIDAGFNLMGGAPHRAPEPLDEVRRLLDIADKYGIGIDLHTDENLYGAYTLPQFARWVREWDRKTRPVTAGHCVRLSTLDADQLADVIAEVKASDIGLIALPITNLYLQGWEHPVATPRGIAPVRALLDAGVRVAGGADNVRDPFNPLGRSDPFETAMLLVTASHLTFTEAYEAVSASARDVMSLPEAGATPGAKAEFLAIKAHDLGDAVATAPADRLVIHRGRLVSQTTTNRVTAW